LHSVLNDERTFTDVEFVVEGRSIYAHRVILILSSEKFKMQFLGHFQESNQGKIKIKVEDYSFDTYKTFLSYLYTTKINLQSADLDVLLELIRLADEHMIDNLKILCERHILEEHNSYVKVENVCELFQYADNFSIMFNQIYISKHIQTDYEKI
jgi:speckle-type POZ protein